MFLTVGEKIRQARQQFNLKQGSFRNFGITQHYLSMIETNGSIIFGVGDSHTSFIWNKK